MSLRREGIKPVILPQSKLTRYLLSSADVRRGYNRGRIESAAAGPAVA